MKSCCSRGSRYLHPSSDPPLPSSQLLPISSSLFGRLGVFVGGFVCVAHSHRDVMRKVPTMSCEAERGEVHRHMSAPVWRLKRHGLSFIYLINILNCLNCLFVEYLLGCISTEDERGDEKSVHVWGHQKSRSCKLLLDIIRVLFYILGPFSLKICFGFSLLLFLVITLCSG